MGIMDDIDKEVKKVKENPDVNKLKKGLERGINTFKEELEKPSDKDSEIIYAEYNNKDPENKTNSNNEPKFCPKCGSNTKPNYNFCKNCGQQLIALNQVETEVEGDNEIFNIGDHAETDINENNKSFIIVNQVEDDVNENNKSFNIANESETEDSSKAFKIPISDKNYVKSNEVIEKNVEFREEKNINLNINDDTEKGHIVIDEDIKENVAIDGDIKEENIKIYSVADEISKFHELKEKGIITSEQFEKKKNQLLDL